MVWMALRWRVAGPGAPGQRSPGFRSSGAPLRYAPATPFSPSHPAVTAKRLSISAQGCRAAATLGNRSHLARLPQRGFVNFCGCETPLGFCVFSITIPRVAAAPQPWAVLLGPRWGHGSRLLDNLLSLARHRFKNRCYPVTQGDARRLRRVSYPGLCCMDPVGVTVEVSQCHLATRSFPCRVTTRPTSLVLPAVGRRHRAATTVYSSNSRR